MSQIIIDNIKDIDFPLYKYGLIHRIDLNNYFVSDRKRRIQKIKSKLIFIILLMNTIRYTFYIIVIKENNMNKRYLDITQYMGGIIKFTFGTALFGSILS